VVDLAGDVPVLAAGGIADGRQMAAALALGADGAWCGSVWLNSHEDITPLAVKRKFIAASSADTVRSRSRTGKPARQLRSAWHDAWDGPGAPTPLPMSQQVLLAKEAWARIDAAAAEGNPGALELESFFIGQVVGSFGELRAAGDIVAEMVAECERSLLRAAALVGS
jgi:NAD(P)H-dependent flavin oxidoreductase YrpB (nitropropane dioxygenase family)